MPMELVSASGELFAGSRSVYLFLAVLGSIIFVIQFIMTVFGFDHEMIDTDGAELAQLNFFSLKGIVSFFTFFGWAGYFWADQGWVGLLLALFFGGMMMGATALLLWGMMKAQRSGNIEPKDFEGETGSVYLSLPGGRKSGGIVTVKLGTCTRQVGAVSDTPLPSGTPVRVEKFLSEDCYLVKSIVNEEN